MPSDHELNAISVTEAKSYIASGYAFVWERDGNGCILSWVVSADQSKVWPCHRRDFVDLLAYERRLRKAQVKTAAAFESMQEAC